MNTSVLSEPRRLAPAFGTGGHGRGRRSEPDLPPGVAHAGTVGPAAGRRRGERARGAVRAHQPQAALRGRRGDVTVHGHSSGREGALACLGREHEWLLVRLLGQSLRTLGHWHLSKDTDTFLYEEVIRVCPASYSGFIKNSHALGFGSQLCLLSAVSHLADHLTSLIF